MVAEKRERDDVDGMAAKKSKREREAEYEIDATRKCMAANPNMPEAKVWFQLQGKSPSMVRLRHEFSASFRQNGFGFVEGSKRMNRFPQDK